MHKLRPQLPDNLTFEIEHAFIYFTVTSEVCAQKVPLLFHANSAHEHMLTITPSKNKKKGEEGGGRKKGGGGGGEAYVSLI